MWTCNDYGCVSGEVLEMTGSEGLILRRVKKGKLFGEVALFIESRRQVKALPTAHDSATHSAAVWACPHWPLLCCRKVRYIAQEFSNVARLDKVWQRFTVSRDSVCMVSTPY